MTDTFETIATALAFYVPNSTELMHATSAVVTALAEAEQPTPVDFTSHDTLVNLVLDAEDINQHLPEKPIRAIKALRQVGHDAGAFINLKHAKDAVEDPRVLAVFPKPTTVRLTDF